MISGDKAHAQGCAFFRDSLPAACLRSEPTEYGGHRLFSLCAYPAFPTKNSLHEDIERFPKALTDWKGLSPQLICPGDTAPTTAKMLPLSNRRMRNPKRLVLRQEDDDDDDELKELSLSSTSVRSPSPTVTVFITPTSSLPASTSSPTVTVFLTQTPPEQLDSPTTSTTSDVSRFFSPETSTSSSQTLQTFVTVPRSTTTIGAIGTSAATAVAANNGTTIFITANPSTVTVTNAGGGATTSITAVSSALGSDTSPQADGNGAAPTVAQNSTPAIPPAAVRALVALGVLAGLSAIIALAVVLWRRKKQKKARRPGSQISYEARDFPEPAFSAIEDTRSILRPTYRPYI